MMIVRTLAVTLLMLAASADIAMAHAKLKSASPASGATVKAGVSEIKLVFGEKLEGALSTVALADATGAAIAATSAGPACAGTTCHITVAPLAAGDYTVKYHILSADGHVVDGKYVFHVKG